VKGKSRKRQEKKARMAKIYGDFFADPGNQQTIEDIKFTWGIEICPRLVRDEVLGRRSSAQNKADS
jgi:hypothetical protein